MNANTEQLTVEVTAEFSANLRKLANAFECKDLGMILSSLCGWWVENLANNQDGNLGYEAEKFLFESEDEAIRVASNLNNLRNDKNPIYFTKFQISQGPESGTWKLSVIGDQ